jgi:hypothetical protein
VRRTATAIGALAVVATLATGCGGGGSSAEVERDTTTTEAEAPSTTVAQSPYSESELTAMLLTATEMGPEWTATTSDPDDDDDQLGCLADLEDDGTVSDEKVEVQFDYGNGQVFVFEGLRWAGDDPQTTFEAVADAITDCEVPAVSGSSTIESIDPIAYPTAGDDSAAWEVTFSTGGQTITMQLILVVEEDVLIQVMGGYPNQTMTVEQSQPIVVGAAQKVATLS